MRTAPLWKLAEVNPPTPEFADLAEGEQVSFLPLEAIWPGDRADYSRTLPWSSKLSYTMFRCGDVLVPKITPTFEAGRSIVADTPTSVGLATTEVHVLRPRPHVDPRMICYMVQSTPFLKEGETALQGVGNLRRVSPMFMQTRPVLDVDYPTQRRIADYLDRETGEIDAMLAKLDALAEVLEGRRTAAIAAELHGIQRMPSITMLVDIESGSGFPLSYQGLTDEELSFHKVSSLSMAIGDVLPRAENSVSRETAKALGASVIPAGSVLMAKIGAALMLGRYARIDEPSCIDNNMQALVPLPGAIAPRYLTYAMSQVSLDLLVKNGPVPSLDVAGLKMTSIPCPASLEEQERIADHLDEVTGRIDAMLAKVAQLKDLLIERRAALITAVVTGQKEVA